MKKRVPRLRMALAATGIVGIFLAFRVVRSANDAVAGGDFDAKLPGAGLVVTLVDGAAVCPTDRGEYLSLDDPTQWTFLPLRTKNTSPVDISFCVGGGRGRLFFVMNTEKSQDDYAVYSLVPGGEPREVRRLSGILGTSRPVAFCTEKIGVVSTGANVGVTVNGGATWHPTPPLFGDHGQQVSLLKWADKSRLLIAGPISDSLSLYEVRPDAALRLVWRKKLPPDVDRNLTPGNVAVDGDQCWVVGKEQFRRLRLADGQQDYSIPRQNFEPQIAAAHGALLAWTPDNLQANTVKPDGSISRSQRFSLRVAGVLALEKPRCLVISQEGQGFELNLVTAKLAPIDLRVTPKWSTPPEMSPEEKRSGELASQIVRLGRQLPRSEAAPLEKAALAKRELTPEQRATWLIGEYKKLLAKYKAEGRVPKLDPRALMLQVVDLANQLPADEVSQVWEAAYKRPVPDPATREQWVKDQLEKLIAKHKADGTLPKPKSDPPDDGAQK